VPHVDSNIGFRPEGRRKDAKPSRRERNHPTPSLEISLIGAGTSAPCSHEKLKYAGHTVRHRKLRGPETLADLAKEVGATAVSVAMSTSSQTC